MTSEAIRQTRAALFNEFTDKIDDLSVPIRQALTTLQTTIDPALSRLREAELGYDDLLKNIPFGFTPPQLQRRTKVVASSEEDICQRLYYFTERGVTISDREKADSYVRELKRNSAAIQHNKDRLSDELTGALTFLESRRNLIWGRDNTARAIEASEANTKLAIKASEKNTLDTITRAEWNTRLSIIISVVVAILVFALNKFSDRRFTDWHRRRANKDLEKTNRNLSDEM